MQFITTNSNIQVEIIPSAFKDAINLKKAAFECLKNEGIIKNVDLGSLRNIELSLLLDKLFSILMNAETSPSFETALFECLKSCTIENSSGVKNKITMELFDENQDLRNDYYEIIYKCIEVNLTPFFKSLVSEFQARLKILNKFDQE